VSRAIWPALKWFGRLSFGAAILWLVWRSAANLRIADLGRAFDPAIIAVALALSFGSWLLAAYKWSVLVPHARFWDVARISFVSQFYGFFLPGQLGGEVLRAILLSRLGNAERAIASVVVDRITGLAGISLLAFLGALWATNSPGRTVQLMFGTLCAVAIAFLFGLRSQALDAAIRAAIGILHSTRWSVAARLGRFLQRLHDALFAFAQDAAVLAASFALGVVFQLLIVATNFVLARHLGISLSAADMAWIVGFVALALLLPVSVAGLGVREATYVGIMQMYGVPVEKSLVLSLAFFALGAIGALTGGCLELWRLASATSK